MSPNDYKLEKIVEIIDEDKNKLRTTFSMQQNKGDGMQGTLSEEETIKPLALHLEDSHVE